MILAIDFETASAADIADGNAPYAQHPSTRPWCAAFVLADDGYGVVRQHSWWYDEPVPDWVLEHLGDPFVRLLAHNASMESSVLRYCNTPFKQHVEPRRWIDSLAYAAALTLPLSLGSLAKALGCKAQKDTDGNTLMRRLCRAKWDGATATYEFVSSENRERLQAYCMQDVLTMLECMRRMPSPPPEELQMQREDRTINERGMLLDTELAAAMSRIATERESELGAEVWGVTEDLVSVNNLPALTSWLKSQRVDLPRVVRKRPNGTFVATPSVAKEAVEELLGRDNLPDVVRKVLKLRQEAGRATSLAKATRVPRVVCRDGRLRNALRYSTAHTGRWSSDALQVHNLARPGKGFKAVSADFTAALRAGDVRTAQSIWPLLEGMSFALRSLIIAPPGREIIGGDYSAIEARVLAWVAGQTDVVDMFRAGLDVYMSDAQKVGSDDRQFGKLQRLGLGYGMAALRFREQGRKAGLDLPLLRYREVVRGWRDSNKAIVSFWALLEEACRNAILQPGTLHGARRVSAIASTQVLQIRLPSGRSLHYWRPRIAQVEKIVDVIDDDGDVLKKAFVTDEIQYFQPDGRRGMIREGTYGGKLTENVVQAIARDLLRDALLNLRGTCYDVIVHVHDSIAAEVDEGVGSVDEFCDLMARRPRWAADLPIAVEGYRARHFKG